MTAAADLDAVAALGDPLRRRLYELAASRAEGVTRDAAAQATGIARHVAAYHLDLLAGHGLLDVGRSRQGGRSGPGAGRPAKVYRRAARAVDVSLPPRNYELASRVLLEAAVGGEAAPGERLAAAAGRYGGEIGAAACARAGSGAPLSREAALRALVDVLRESGFEPNRAGGEVRLGNCAFHELAERDRAAVCSMNLSLMRGIAGALGMGDSAVAEPGAAGCCVVFRAHAGGGEGV